MVWSQQLYEIFGVDPDDIEPSLDSTLQFIHTDDRPLVETSCHPESAGGNDFGREVRIIRRDGKERIVYFQTHCLRNKKGELKSLVGNLTDITERKIKDSERQQDMKLHSLGSLASGMAHSLNNLILPILISSRMALRGLRDDQATRDRLARVVNASEKASALVSRVLDFSRQKEPSFVQFNLSDVLRDGLRLIQVTAPSSIRIDSELSNQPMMISGQPSQLETIVLDLASNAFDSMRGTNGRLLIRLAGKTVEREITGFPNSVLPGHYAYLQIKDSGTGMDKETLQKAFI
jgi:PAS domain S-box-containing protein